MNHLLNVLFKIPGSFISFDPLVIVYFCRVVFLQYSV